MLVCFSSKMAKGTYWFFLVVVWSTRHLAPSHPALSLFLFCFCFVFDFVLFLILFLILIFTAP